MKDTIKFIDKYLVEIAFVASTSAAIASLTLSNIAELEPCTLCWYQRIFMFPLPFIFGAAALYKNNKAFVYTLPLILIGFMYALYQNLLVWGVISEESATCSINSVSCIEQPIEIFGFLTIPFGSMMIFALLGVLMLRQAYLQKWQAGFKKAQQDLFTKLILLIGVISIISIILTYLFYEK